MHRRIRHLACIVFFGAIAIACSKKDEPSATSAPPPPPEPPPTATAVSEAPPAEPSPSASSVVRTPTAAPAPAAPPSVSDKRKHSGKKDLKAIEDDGDSDLPMAKTQTAQPAKPKPTATVSPSTPAESRREDEKPKDRESQPSATALEHRVTVTTSSHYVCTTKEPHESVSVSSETRGARITIGGQGPCPGEIKEWIAEVGDKRVDVHGTHGAQSKCRCAGTGDMVLRGLDPGTYDVHVNGGFNRPIAVRVVVGSP